MNLHTRNSFLTFYYAYLTKKLFLSCIYLNASTNYPPRLITAASIDHITSEYSADSFCRAYIENLKEQGGFFLFQQAVKTFLMERRESFVN